MGKSNLQGGDVKMTENLEEVIRSLTDNDWDHTFENGIHIFKKYKLKIDIFWHSGAKKIWEIHLHEGGTDKTTITTIEDKDLSYPLILENGFFNQ